MSARPGRGPAQRTLALSPAAERARVEETALLRRYKAWRRQSYADLLEGPHGTGIRDLMAFLRAMGLRDGKALLDRVRGATWLLGATEAVRFVVLRMIGAAIARVREREGLDPWDDPVWDRPPGVFQMARDLLRTGLARDVA